MGNTQQLYGRLDMVMLDRQDKIYGSLGMHDSYLLNTVTGNPLTLTHSREGKFEDEVTDAKIFGWSKQESTTGAQLYDMDTRLNVDGIEYEKEGTSYTVNIIKMSGNLLYVVPFQFSKEDVDATLSVSEFFNLEQANVRINLLDSEGKTVGTLWADKTKKELSAKCSKIRFDWSYSGKFKISNLMLNWGSTALPYEPYTGGKPSPSPDYPQDIESAENPTVTVRGKNLFSGFVFGGTNPKNENGITTTKEGALYIRSDYIPCEVGKHYVYNIPEGWRASQTVFCNSDKKYIRVASPPHSFTVPENAAYFVFQIAKKDTTPIYQADLDAVSKLVQVEQADACTEYEPYHEPQSLTIQTPNGLPGIPVDTGGNYTDASGQQWIADYIDLKRGKYVQRVWQKTFDGSESMGIYDNIRGFFIRNVLPNNYYKRKGFMNQQKVFFIGLGNKYLYINESEFYDEGLTDKGLSNWKAHLAEHPLVVMTYLDEPIERDLTPSEIQVYQNLVTYAGTTIVENDQDCYMEVTYKASGNE